MANRDAPVIDMTPQGNFVDAPKPSLTGILLRLAAFGIFLCVVAVLFWTALILLPFLLLLGVIGYFAVRAQLRRNGMAVYTFRR